MCAVLAKSAEKRFGEFSPGCSTNLKQARVLIAGDYPLICDGLASLLRRELGLEVCAQAGSRNQALRLAEEMIPDLVIMDVALTSFEGFDLIKDLRSRFSRLKILVVSMCDENVNAGRVIQAGGNGFIHMRVPIAEILAAVRQVMRGDVYLSPGMRTQLLSSLVRPGRIESPPAVLLDLLTDRELQILDLIGEGVGRGEIAERLCLHVNTIETYRTRIKLKLQLKDANELLRYAIHSKHRAKV